MHDTRHKKTGRVKPTVCEQAHLQQKKGDKICMA